jgi:small subunit ribosomal protein S2
MEVREKNLKQKKTFQKNPKKFGPQNGKENLQQGDILTVKIQALGSKNIGVAELRNGTTLLVPNTKCGENVQVKIEKVFLSQESDLKKVKYAVGTVVQPSLEGKIDKSSRKSFQFDLKVGQKFKVTIQKKGPKKSGFVPISPNFLIIIPNAKVGEKLVVEIQKIKQNYAFATPVVTEKENTAKISDFVRHENTFVGQEFHIDLPATAKTFGNFYVVKFHGRIVFVKKGLGVQSRDRVQIQIQKATENFAIAKIQKISPLSVEERKVQVKQNLEKMIQSSMHFGEKAIHCNANMRKYLWYRKNGSRLFGHGAGRNGTFQTSQNHHSNSFSIFSPASLGKNTEKNSSFFQQSSESLLHSQFGNSNGKRKKGDQKPMVKRGRHILNLFKTERCFHHALKQLAKYAAKGKTFLFIGTKKPAASLIAKTALLSHTSFFVNTRWLGGMLTNWKTILKSIAQIRPLLKQKQKIQKKIFEKRQKIQRRLFLKVSLLRKKSQKFLSKGKYLISQILKSQTSRIEKNQKLLQRKNALFAANLSLVNASKKLKAKKIERFQKIQAFEVAATKILFQKKQLRSLLAKNLEKFAELEKFYEIGQEFLKFKNSFESAQQFKKFVAVSYTTIEKMKETGGQTNVENWQVPNPSPEIFKKMISLLFTYKKGNFSHPSFVKERNTSFSNRSKSTEMKKQTAPNLLFSKFLNKFILFLPFLQNSLHQLSAEILSGQKILENFQKTFEKIVQVQKIYKEMYQKTVTQFSFVCSKLVLQRKNFEAFQFSLKQFAAEERLLKFLPKFRYFPTSKAKMYETLEFFMKKFVDPKFIYPMEQIYDQKLKFTSKKIATTRKQKWQRLEKYFGGITKMAKMNKKQISKNVAIIVGQQEEMSAVRECRKLGMKIFAIVDTNCDPKFADHIIPANDDSRNSIHYVLGEMLRYIRLGQKLRRKISFRAKMRQTLNQKRRFSS